MGFRRTTITLAALGALALGLVTQPNNLAAQDRAAQDKAAQDKAVQDKAGQDKGAQDKGPQEKKKEWKERGEYDLYDAALKDPAANTRLDTLDKWKKQYSRSDYADVRLQIYLLTYRQLNRPREAFDTAAEILQQDPGYVPALATVLGNVYQLNPQSPQAADLEIAEKESLYLLSHLDAVYAPDKRPADTKEADWVKAKPEMKTFAQKTLGWVYWTRKDSEKAEVELTKAMELDPNQAQVSYWLASAILAQNKTKPEKQPIALYHFARAASYEGPGSLPAPDRKQIETFLTKAYETFHGSGEGLDKILAVAKVRPMPPPDFRILTSSEIVAAKLKAEEEAAKANPMLALWRDLKRELTSDNGSSYFDSSMKGAELPGGVNGVATFKGKLVSMTPAVRPKQLVLAMEDPASGEVTLKLDSALPGKMEPGSDIEFQGVADAYTKEPFMVTFEVEKAKIVGWTGKNEVTKKSNGGKKAGESAKKS